METIFAESKAFYKIGFFERTLWFCLFAFSEANWAYNIHFFFSQNVLGIYFQTSDAL